MSLRDIVDLNPMAGIDLPKVHATKKLIRVLQYLEVLTLSEAVDRLRFINNSGYRYHLFLKKST